MITAINKWLDTGIIELTKKNNIYLINSAGRILWKINIPEKIISEIYQIDFYKNNKLQLLFNTKNHVYLIDRNGNFTDGYPFQKQVITILVSFNHHFDYR